MKNNKHKTLLILVLVLSLFLRLYRLDQIPASLFGDEIDMGYQAWSLGTTARDYMGNLLPTFLHSFSEWRTPLLSYLLSPILAIFGPSTLSVRIPVALMGVLNIYLICLFFQRLFPKYKDYSLLAALILAVTPWHIHFSRIAVDSTLLLNLYLLGAILILGGKFAQSLPILILTLYTYPTANIFTPLLLITVYFVIKPKILFRKYYVYYLLSLLLIVPVFYNIINGSASGRFGGISIFSDTKIVESVINNRTEYWVLGHGLESVFHNKPLIYLSTFTNQYISAFSTTFLFVSGDPNFRHSVGEYGEFYLFFAPLLFIGYYSLSRRLLEPNARLLLAWIIIAPIPAALTHGGGSHAIRLIILLPALVVLFTLAVIDITIVFKKRISKTIFNLLFICLSFLALVFYWHRYSDHYRFLSYRNWQYGYQAVMSKVPAISPTNNLFINNTYEPSLTKYLFYSKYPPIQFQKKYTGDTTVNNIYQDISGFRLGDNIYFVSPRNIDIVKLLNPGDLYIAVQSQEIPGDWNWTVNPPSGIEVIAFSNDEFDKPLIYLLRKN